MNNWLQGIIDLPAKVSKIINLLEVLNMKIEEATRRLEALGDRLTKILEEVQALKASAKDQDLPAEFVAGLGRVEQLAGQVDDENPDQPAPTPEGENPASEPSGN